MEFGGTKRKGISDLVREILVVLKTTHSQKNSIRLLETEPAPAFMGMCSDSRLVISVIA